MGVVELGTHPLATNALDASYLSLALSIHVYCLVLFLQLGS